MQLQGIHHVAIICADYARSKQFYSGVLGLTILAEHYQAQRGSYKLDLALPNGQQLELFYLPAAPPRPSYPEAQGLRHLAFKVSDLAQARQHLVEHQVTVEAIRLDPYTGQRFMFFQDPDGLPLELYEQVSTA